MPEAECYVTGQMRLGDAELTSFSRSRILDKIRAARDLAGLGRLLLLPSHDQRLNDAILRECRKMGIEVYLWYKVLTDNDIMPAQKDLLLDALGNRWGGESGLWHPIFESEESFHFVCPRNSKYNNMLLNRCEQKLPDYDGLFADFIGFPLPSLGFEMLFSCFCHYCLEDQPKLRQWRHNILESREAMMSATDDDLERWGTFFGVGEFFELTEFYQYRVSSITHLATQYTALARRMEKPVGLDVVTPAFAMMAGQDYQRLGHLADWMKPRIYLRTFGPSSVPLELRSLALGVASWAGRFSMQAILRYIERSTGLRMPENIHALDETYFPPEVAADEIEIALQAPCPVYPGLECSRHPEYDTAIDASTIGATLEASAKAPGVVLSWNILYSEDENLKLIGDTVSVG